MSHNPHVHIDASLQLAKRETWYHSARVSKMSAARSSARFFNIGGRASLISPWNPIGLRLKVLSKSSNATSSLSYQYFRPLQNNRRQISSRKDLSLIRKKYP